MNWAVPQADSEHTHPNLCSMHATGFAFQFRAASRAAPAEGHSRVPSESYPTLPYIMQGGDFAVLCRAAAALVASERGNDLEAEAPPPQRHSSAPEISCSPPNGRMSRMQLSQEDSQGKQVSLAMRITPPVKVLECASQSSILLCRACAGALVFPSHTVKYTCTCSAQVSSAAFVVCDFAPYHDDEQIFRQESSGFASWMQKAHCGKHGRGQSRSHQQEQQNNSSAAAEELQEDGQLFPAWLTQQVVRQTSHISCSLGIMRC